MAQFDLKKATVQFKDGTGTPNTLTLKVAEGVLSFTERFPRKYTKDRGKLSTVVDGDEEPVEIRMDLIYEFMTASSGSPTPSDVLKKEGQAASWVSAAADACEPYAVDIVITFTGACGANTTETITLADFRVEQLDYNLKDGTLSVTGKANVTKATAVRS